MARFQYDPQLHRVRDIPDVAKDCRAILITKTGTNKVYNAASAALHEAWREYEFNQGVIDEPEDGEKDPSRPYIWLAHGQHQAYATIIRRMADELGVSNFCERKPPDAEDPVGLEGQGQVDPAGSGGSGSPG
jgi:hypothetical protein